MYGKGFGKLDIGKYRGNMMALKEKDPGLFIEYGLRDAVITLKHINEMEGFYFRQGRIGVPLTLSSLSKAYVLKEWGLMGYKGYQFNKAYSFGDMKKLINPKGINETRGVGLALPYFIASMRGGRNESYMYGLSRSSEEKNIK